jgi:hypothetical protein
MTCACINDLSWVPDAQAYPGSAVPYNCDVRTVLPELRAAVDETYGPAWRIIGNGPENIILRHKDMPQGCCWMVRNPLTN